MHEYSVMTQIMDSILAEAGKRKATKVEEVDIEVGEFTLLGIEQLRFAYELMSKDTITEGSRLNISELKGKVRCTACGFEGSVSVAEDSPHRLAPVLTCPKCGGIAQITEGRECLIRNIRMVVPDV